MERKIDVTWAMLEGIRKGNPYYKGTPLTILKHKRDVFVERYWFQLEGNPTVYVCEWVSGKTTPNWLQEAVREVVVTVPIEKNAG